ncbi:hypothetical protein Tco_0127451 [Tanacetum coccineum]
MIDVTIEDKPLKHVTPAMEDLFRKHVDSLLKIGAIRPSKSRHRTMAMIVNSGTTIDPATGREVKGKERMVFNYKSLNDNTYKDQYSLPGINTIIKRIGEEQRYFSKSSTFDFQWERVYWRTGTIKLQPHIIKKIVNFNEEELKTKKGLRSFIESIINARNHIQSLGILYKASIMKRQTLMEKKIEEPSYYEFSQKKINKEQVQKPSDLEIPPKMLTSSWKQMEVVEGWGGIIARSKEGINSSSSLLSGGTLKDPNTSQNNMKNTCRRSNQKPPNQYGKSVHEMQSLKTVEIFSAIKRSSQSYADTYRAIIQYKGLKSGFGKIKPKTNHWSDQREEVRDVQNK